MDQTLSHPAKSHTLYMGPHRVCRLQINRSPIRFWSTGYLWLGFDHYDCDGQYWFWSIFQWLATMVKKIIHLWLLVMWWKFRQLAAIKPFLRCDRYSPPLVPGLISRLHHQLQGCRVGGQVIGGWSLEVSWRAAPLALCGVLWLLRLCEILCV